MRKDVRYARACVGLYEKLHSGEITKADFQRRLAELRCGNKRGPKKPEKQFPPALLPGLDGVPRA